jgi:hypothetical protein
MHRNEVIKHLEDNLEEQRDVSEISPCVLNKKDLDKQQVEAMLHNLIQEWGLTPLGQNIAFLWLSRAAGEDSEHLSRLRKFTLMKLNKQLRPLNISPWQYGCPNLLPGLQCQPVWRNNMHTLFPWIRTVEEAFPRIREELLSLKNDSSAFQPYRAPSWAGTKKVNFCSSIHIYIYIILCIHRQKMESEA